ncbi:T1SS-143 repeat domain-containing protein [Marinobacter sp. 1Y8]
MAVDQVQFVIVIDGRYWWVLEDGTLVAVDPSQIPNNAIVINSAVTGDGAGSPAAPSDAASAPRSVLSLVAEFDNVERDGAELLPESGFDTLQLADMYRFAHQDRSGFPADDPLPPPLDPLADVTVVIDDRGDGFINRYEIPTVDLFGDTIELRDGQFLEITVTDSQGASISFGTVVSNGSWSLPDRDLSSLAEGEVTAVVTARDNYGNSVSASDTSVIDTLATINDDAVFNGGTLLNAVEVLDVDLNGTTADIGDNRPLEVEFRDEQGATITAATQLDDDGNYQIDDVDISSLADGDIQLTFTSQDIAGNIAENITTIVKDTQAAIDLKFDGMPPYSTSEVALVTVSGTVADVEAGQQVNITVTDNNGHSQQTTAIVQADGSWQTTTLDITGYDDGTIEALAAVEDVAGNTADNTTTAIKDTEVTIDIETGTGLDIDALRTGQTVVIEGTTDAETGQTVVLRFADPNGGEQTFNATVQAGGGWSTSVALSGLNNVAAWTLSATVQDVAGNEASDATPTLVIPTPVVLSEKAVDAFPAGFSENSIIRIQDYDAVQFGADQSALETVKSGGINLSVVVAGGGQSLVGSAGGTQVLEAVINGDGTITVTLFERVDQDALSNLLKTGLALEATQNDPDGTSETVIVQVPVAIRDGGTFVNDDSYTGIEDTLITGQLFGNDNLAEGPLRLVSIDLGSGEILLPASGSVTETTPKGILTVNADGTWSLQAARNLDNSQPQQLTFSYSALDQDKDFDTADVVIDISDGAAGIVGNGEVTATEATYSDATPQLINFSVQAGSDDLDPTTIAFGEGQLDQLNGLGYQSNGVPLVYSLNGDNEIVAKAGADTVFTITLSAVDDNGNLNATATLVQSLPLDHNFSESLSFPLIVVATDTDGTEASASSTLNILDGANPVTTSTGVAVNEDSLPSGATDSGQIAITIGSDQVDAITFLQGQPALTSGGQVVSYELLNGGATLRAFIADGNIDVFTVELQDPADPTTDSAIDYDFTLLRAIDELDANGAPSSPLSFDLAYQVTDSDGDIAQSAITVAITDGSAATGSGPTISLSEAPPAFGNRDVPSSASGNFSLTAEKDPVTAANFELVEGDTVTDAGAATIERNGEPLTWQRVSDVRWQAVDAAGTVALDLRLPDTINIDAGDTQNVPVTVSVLAAIDHISSDTITLNVPVTFTDSDGTETLLSAAVDIADGRDPVFAGLSPLDVDEAGTLSGQVTDNGQASGAPGSDALVGYNVAMTTGVSSQGAAVTLAGSPTSEGWWIGSNGTEEVFRLRIGVDGTTEFVQSAPIDHPNAGADIFTIEFDVSANDADGDTSNSRTLEVNVTDDVPVTADQTLNLTEGNSRSTNLLADGRGGADGAELTQITYDGTNYTFNAAKDPIVIMLENPSQVYGQATIQADGNVLIQTEPSFNATFSDSFDFQVTDGDSDTVVNTLDLNVSDELGAIEISPLVTPEDTPLSLTLRAYPGDLDDNESVRSIAFDAGALQGGTLSLNGVSLPTDGSGDPVLSDANLLLVNAATGEVQPNGNLVFTPAPNSSDPTAQVDFNVTMIIDADDGQRTQTDNFDVSVTPVVDAPVWAADAVFDYSMDEDGTPPSLSLDADLVDTDGSEALSYRVENIAADITLSTTGRTIGEGDVLSNAELAALGIKPDANFAGQRTFDIVAISQETSTGDSAEITETVTLNVAPVADTPTLATANVFSLEDQLIAIDSMVLGGLTDTDGSETLSYQLTVPEDWMVVDASGNETGLVSTGIYRVPDSLVSSSAAFLKPKEDISSIDGNFQIKVKAISTESDADGIAPTTPEAESAERTVIVDLQGVVDTPAIGPGADGAWSFDGTNITATYNEDDLVPLNFSVGTNDDDGSEIFDFVLRDLPDGAQLVDASGNPLDLKVTGEYNGKPTYSLTATELGATFVKPPADYSGQLTFELQQFNVEPDGDSGEFDLIVDITLEPQVDTADGLRTESSGAEDSPIELTLLADLPDVDGSETITDIIIEPLPSGAVLMFDGAVVVVPASGLNLQDFAATRNLTLKDLTDSQRLTVTPPEDSGDDLDVNVIYEITDTSDLGATAVKNVSGVLHIDVTAIVDDTVDDGITRIATDPATQVSADGSPITLNAAAATFIEEDIDGSEYLDYIALTMPEATGWYVSHPNGAINDGQGNWLIPATGLTSDSAVDSASALLAGVTIASDHATAGPIEIVVSARVIDSGDDADIISNTLLVDFQAPGNGGSAQAVSALAVPGSIIDGQEGETVDTTGHLNTNAAGDANDVVSFRIDAGDVPYGGGITGADVVVRYADDGTTPLEYLFTDASLGNLQIVGVDEDFAGATTMVVNKISTDPLGDTNVTQETLNIDIQPVVDDLNTPPTFQLIEDTPQRLNINLDALLSDRSTATNEGIETIDSLHFIGPVEGSFLDPLNLLADDGSGGYTLNDPTRIGEIFYVPPENKHGSVTLDFEVTVTDTTTGITASGLSNSVTSTLPGSAVFEIRAVTDKAPVTAINQTGDEDTDIALTGLAVDDIDNDGSETLTMQLRGVPDGAILFADTGSGLVQLDETGSDGAGANVWTFLPSQLGDLVLRPPRDFSGDIELTLESISMEQSTQDVVVSQTDFTVGVNPIADGAVFSRDSADVFVNEGETINIGIYAQTEEAVNPDETLVVAISVKDTSDATATTGLLGIRAPDGQTALFQMQGTTLVAVVTTTLAQLATLELVAADNAFGNLDIDISVGSNDSAIVNGVTVSDSTSAADAETQSISVTIAPVATPPIVDIEHQYIVIGDDTVPLDITLTPVNPAATETRDVLISGVPDGASLSEGTRSGSDWVVAENQLPGLSMTGATADDYTLSVQGRSTLNGQTVSGPASTIDIEVQAAGNNVLAGDNGIPELIVGGSGNDTLTGGTGADQFLFRTADVGSSGSPAQDQITDFSVADTDSIDLSDLAIGFTTGTDFDAIIDLSESGGSTTLSIDVGSGTVQEIELAGVSKDDLYGADAAGASDADILQKMIDDQTLMTGN